MKPLQPERTSRLIARLKSHLASAGISQVAFSRELGLSAQNFSLIIRGINSPNSETTLQIQEFLEAQIMKTDVDPPKMPRLSTRDLNRPRTLSEAGEVIETLRTELAQSKAGSGTPAKTITPAPSTRPRLADANLPPVYPTGGPLTSGKPAAQMPINFPAPEKKLLPASCNTPYLIGEILKITSLEDLSQLLNNPDHSPLQQSCIYQEIKSRRNLMANRFQ